MSVSPPRSHWVLWNSPKTSSTGEFISSACSTVLMCETDWETEGELYAAQFQFVCFLTVSLTHYIMSRSNLIENDFLCPPKKYILRSMPTTLLFSLLFSMAGTLPHLPSEDYLLPIELVPGKTRWLRFGILLKCPPLIANSSVLRFVLYMQPWKRLTTWTPRMILASWQVFFLKNGNDSFLSYMQVVTWTILSKTANALSFSLSVLCLDVICGSFLAT